MMASAPPQNGGCEPFQVFAILAAMYYLVCWSLTRAALLLERRITRKRAGQPGVVPPSALEPQTLTAEP